MMKLSKIAKCIKAAGNTVAAKNKQTIDLDKIAEVLKTSPEALQQFEQKYQSLLDNEPISDNFFEVNAKQAASAHNDIIANHPDVNDMITRIVNELLNDTPVWSYDGKTIKASNAIGEHIDNPVTNAEIKTLPVNLRPQCTGSLAQVEINGESYIHLVDMWMRHKNATDSKDRQMYYHMFRQGLDILDLDGITYEMLGTNPNAMGNWLPQIAEAVIAGGFFKIPKTTIIKVPLPLLQLTRLEYATLTRTTLDIVDEFCQKIFDLDESKDYFIKTGTFSSKFDFRNARVTGAKEVRELGEYLVFIQHQATMMAGPLTRPCRYGASTTNEWVVREFIHDTEDNPCIYKGLPLHTEYRVFADFDTKEILGISPYWRSDVMKQRFGNSPDSNSPHNIHDYAIYAAHEATLNDRYEKNKDLVTKHIETLLQDTENLSGQWSIDIMQNGNDFYLIDMALAENSALNDCVPADKLKAVEENWMPVLPNK